ncbi:MAG TPA: ATP-binding protein, partial [Deltaproteobacteria bacterium]|nr:ATP-binding protein [Deltaproteobacteria bacterium]
LLQEIMQAAKMGTDLAKQIVTFSRKESQEKRPVAIEPVVREAVDFLKSALPSTIDIHQKLTSGGACVLADPTRIKQVMVNLGTNAGYAMKEKGGELDVKLIREDLGEEEAQKVSVDLSAGPYVRIIVRDTGAGMDDRTRQRIFEPFFTTKEHGEGTGMGLAVVHGIIREYGGAVTVWSKPGKGSTFSVWLPVLQEDRKKQGREPAGR